MQNGNAFLAFTVETQQFLVDKTVIAYYQAPLPAELDHRFDAILSRFMAALPDQRELFQQSLAQSQRSLFGIYGHRTATRAVREEAPDLLLLGLVGTAVANFDIPSHRRVEVGLAVFYHCARKLGIMPADLFTQAADYATPELVPQLVSFGNRSNVTLRQFGWTELKTSDGYQYKFNWV